MERSAMRRALSFCLLGCAMSLAAQSPFPANSTSLPSQPFFIKHNWIIGGTGNWDYLTIDPVANRLYIAHGPEVQVVDVQAGNLAGTVKGLEEAHSIALDDTGEFGYVSDGPADEVKVFDRRSYQVVGYIPTGPSPRAIALDAESNLLIAVCAGPNPAPLEQAPQRRSGRPQPRPAAQNPSAQQKTRSILSVIDAQTREELAQILVAGRFSFVQGDEKGKVYIAVPDRDEIAQLDLDSLGAQLRRSSGAGAAGPAMYVSEPQHLDWSDSAHPPAGGTHLSYYSLGSTCSQPSALAVDGKDLRVFAACSNLKLAVLNANSGATVTTLPIGPDAQAVGYDPDRGLIYSANGGGDGSLTIIRQDVTDSYAVIQTLATRQQARTLAVNPSTGQVYLVTVIQVAKLGRPPVNGIGTLQVVPQDSSFQVLVVGN
jgi:DNA-binding beta-propeller fold protein YncE